ncbi:PBECR2 nuclease fold domain-containing protein, partial [Helicobacter baculiformis]
LTQDLNPQQIKAHIEQWDLSPEANANNKQRLRVSKIDPIEAQELAQSFNFKGRRELVREIDAHQVIHALREHGDATKEAKRGQIAITIEDIAHYQDYLKNPDFKSVQENGRIVYGKQINGHGVVIEEALTGQDKLRFFDMWKVKGALNKEVLLAHSQRPNTTPSLNLEGYMPSSGTNPTTQELKSQALELHTTAKEQEEGFKELLDGLKSPNNSLEVTNTLKGLESVQEKLEYYKGDMSKINDTLRGAVFTDKQAFNAEFMRVLEYLETNPNLSNITPKFIKTQDGYTGAHINFNYKSVPAEIQVHTPKSWEVKKALDPLYKEKRRLYLAGKLSNKDIREFKRKMKAIGQESDLDSSLLTSFKLTSPQASSTMSVLAKKSGTDLKDTQEPLLKSNSNPGTSSLGSAYNRLESKLNQKSTSLTGGKGTDTGIQTPLNESSTSPLKITPNPKKNDLEQAWLKAFDLNSLDEPFIPKFSPAVQEALEPILKGETIQLTRGSLAKLAKRQREEFLPLIRPTLEEPNAVLDNGRGILFIKEFIGADKNRYFMSVAKNYSGERVFSSHMRKDFSAIKNEFKRSKVLYNAGFSGGEVAGASDILGSGGTAMKPSDLQIDTPPKHSSALNPEGEPTTQELKSQAHTLHTTAKEQEEGFKELLEGLKGGDSTLEASSILKSVGSIESKIKRKRGDIGAINDLLRGALITPTKDALDSQLVRIVDVLESKGITPTIELQHRNAGYKGLHVQFTYEGIPSEIQVHTAQSWGVKKKLDESYHVLREQEIKKILTDKDIEALAEESRRLAQEVDLEMSSLASFELSLDKFSNSEKSVLVRKSSTDLNDSQNSRLKSYSNRAFSEEDTAYSRLESKLNQNVNLSTGKGNIQTPLNE